MASNDPGLATAAALGEDPKRGSVSSGIGLDDERPVAPDQFDEKYETGKWEIWAYYWSLSFPTSPFPQKRSELTL